MARPEGSRGFSIVKCGFIKNTTGQAASLKEPSFRPAVQI